ncbi:DUF1090 domain-containing protein [Halopseudomonas bauzanensis]|uniref:DUF1090 domain-containing protein n=1 Tax=Halopseudomonas bauzanensis TaxID=653930 RepID=A0A1H9P155_9GAMM|nr:DUF1090 domain-containing protein [Halopseudomonas bauzanensis]SER41918.1 Protein of unknown function [Halopseudomonas bauzanensis]SFL76744.1 Protein of unknown function [Halopseudomonas bauzanensis]
MKKTLLVALLLSLPVHAGTPAAGHETCADKEQRIMERLQRAEAANNQGQVRGLNKALKEVRDHCTEEGLAAERKQRIAESEAEVAERREDLAEAIRDGDKEKIEKREGKLTEALQELNEARAE